MNLEERFFNRFRGLLRAHGTYQELKSHSQKVSGKARTIKEPVTVKKWSQHLAGKQGLGIVPINDEGFSWFGAIDVDVYNLDLIGLEKRLRDLGLPLVLCRTKSGGAHLYIFFKEPVYAGFVREKLMEWSIFLGLTQVEVFPKQAELGGEDDVGSWINMPYYGGDNTNRYAIVNGKRLSASEFIDYAEAIATTRNDVEALNINQDDDFQEGPPCLQYLVQAGFPEGTRNQGLFNLSVFAKMKFGDNWKDKVKEFNYRYMVPPLEKQEVETIIKSVDRRTYFYKCKELPISSFCNRLICSRRTFGVNRSGNDPGIIMDGMTKILTDPPMWLLNVNGRRIKLNSTDDFLQQNKFAKVCVESYNIIPNKVNENVWRELIRSLLDKVEEIEAPVDAGPKGEFLLFLERFCSERALAKFQDELLLGKPWRYKDQIMFRSIDMLEWMKKKKFYISGRDAWNYLREIKAEAKSLYIKGKHVRVWIVPTSVVLSELTEPLDLPEIKKEDELF